MTLKANLLDEKRETVETESESVLLEIVPGVQILVDREDVERIKEKKWRFFSRPGSRPKILTSNYGEKGTRHTSLGRFLLNPPQGKQVYCREHNGVWDFRKKSLIVCTLQQRQCLLPKRKSKTTSRYRGVYFCSSNRKWRAMIQINGASRHIGVFQSEVEAALAYNREARRHFGDFAFQNQIEEAEQTPLVPEKKTAL